MSTLAVNLSEFEMWVRRIPFSRQMREKANNQVGEIRENSDKMLDELNNKSNKLIADMDSAHYYYPAESGRIARMKDCVYLAAERGTRHIKQGNNTAIQHLDSSSSTAHLIYENIYPSFLPFTDI